MKRDPVAYFKPQDQNNIHALIETDYYNSYIEGETITQFPFERWMERHKTTVTHSENIGDLSERIMRIFCKKDYLKGPIDNFLVVKEEILNKINVFIKAQKPIEFVMPAYPGRSFNLLTHTRRAPDLGEFESLCLFWRMNEEVKSIYSPGVKWIIIQNTEVYAPFYGYTKEGLIPYRNELIKMINELGGDQNHCFEFVNMKDLINEREEEFTSVYSEQKRELIHRWGDENHKQKEKVAEAMRLGSNSLAAEIASIKLLDYYHGDKTISHFNSIKKSIQQRAESTALQFAAFLRTVHQMKLFEKKYPSSIRATVHPKTGQYSPHFISPNNKIVPWHGVAVLKDNGEVISVYESVVISEPLRYRAVYIEGEYTPFYYKEI